MVNKIWIGDIYVKNEFLGKIIYIYGTSFINLTVMRMMPHF